MTWVLPVTALSRSIPISPRSPLLPLTAMVTSLMPLSIGRSIRLKNWSYAYGTTAATTTLADTKYNDADKFYVGNVKGTASTLLPLGIPSLTLMPT